MFSNNNSDILDKLVAELDRRYKSCNALAPLAFLNKIHILLTQDFCSVAAVLQIKTKQKKTHLDLQEDFPDEIEPFGEFIRTKENRGARPLLHLTKKIILSPVFPNKVDLSLLVTSVSGVFSFSKPGLVKNRLWSTMGKDTLEPKLEVSHFPLTSTKVIFLCSVPFYHLVHGVQYSLKCCVTMVY